MAIPHETGCDRGKGRLVNDAVLVHDFLIRAAEARGDAPALVEPERTATYAELARAARQVAAWLGRHGVERGDRVALLARNGFLYVAAYYGILEAGGVAVPVDPALGGPAFTYVLDDCRPRAVVHDRAALRTVQAVTAWPESTAALIHDGATANPGGPAARASLEEIQAGGDAWSPVRLIDQDLASIVYTSGSTGRPKGVMLSHLNLVANTRSIVSYLELTERDRVLVVLPFHYVYGKSLLNTHVAVGGAVAVDNRFLYPKVVLERLRDEAATGFAGVPSTFTILLHRTPLESMDFPALRYVTQAGGAMAPATIRRLLHALPDQKIYIMYGATEASARLAYLDPTDLLQKVGSIGKPIPNVDLYPVREDGTRCKPGEEGELVARGSNIMRGYWNDPEETGRVLRDGLYHTGDLGTVDRDGFLTVVGRKKSMIKVGGGRVSPQEIEDALAELDGVEECAVVGVPDEVLGEAPAAFVVVDPDRTARDADPVTRESLLAALRARLAPFKVPRHITFVDALPRNAAGKIQRTALIEPAPVEETS